MIDDHDLFERAVERFAPPERSFERLVTRRDRKHRNKRITAGVVALVVAAIGTGALVRALPSGTVPADDPSTTFEGTWNSTELEFRGSTQSMTIRPAEDGLFDIVLRDNSSFLCSSRRTRVDGVETPATMTGAGRLEDATTLVVPSPVLTCADGREPTLSWSYSEEGRPGYTLVLDRATDRLFDNLGVAWHRGAPPEDGAAAEAGWTASMPGGAYSMLGGEITFQALAGGPWTDHAEAYIDDRWFFLLGEPGSGLADGTSIDIVVNASTEAPCEAPASVPASAQTMIRTIRANPDLDTTEPVVERIGGLEARRLDVAAVPGAPTCVDGAVPILSVPGRPWGDIESGERMRLYVLHMTGGFARSLVIMISAPATAFKQTVEAAAPVLDSFEFHAE
jgi:hypothetical protein